MPDDNLGLPASGWERHFRAANIEAEKLAAGKSSRARSTIVGQFLAKNVGRVVPIEVQGRRGTATLRAVDRRSGTKVYYFELRWLDCGDPPETHGAPNGGGSPVTPGPMPFDFATAPPALASEQVTDTMSGVTPVAAPVEPTGGCPPNHELPNGDGGPANQPPNGAGNDENW